MSDLANDVATADSLSYEDAKAHAAHDDVTVRRALAAREDVAPELLYYLASDKDDEVRRIIAANPATPRQADLLLSKDSDETVRTGLAEKIALLAPGLTMEEVDKVQDMTHQALEVLARDQVVTVRRILSETLKDVAEAPVEVIRQLAHDAELVVSGPVLEYSPVLTDEDLLEIISSKPVSGTLSAIARRYTVGPEVSDAIYESDDISAISDMLANENAQIREETLDLIIDQAVDIEAWHGPLVARPKLSAQAGRRLAGFVAENLLNKLVARKDLEPDAIEQVREEFDRRMEQIEAFKARPGESALDRAKRLKKDGLLNEEMVLAALRSAETDLVKACVSLVSGVDLKIVEKIVSTSSVKGIVALAWKAKYSMKMAVQFQQRLAKVPPRDVVSTYDGRFPFSEEEMKWQLDFFKDMS